MSDKRKRNQETPKQVNKSESKKKKTEQTKNQSKDSGVADQDHSHQSDAVNSDNNQTDPTSGTVETPQTESHPSVPPKTPKEKKIKCTKCKGSVGVMPFSCRCGGLFCSSHRYANEHDCTYDYRKHGAEEIRKKNPQVIGEKIAKI